MNSLPGARVSLIFGGLIAALLVFDIGLRLGESKRPASPTATKVVSAQEFQVLAADGKIRARLMVAQDRPSLVLYDSDGSTPRALFGVTTAGDPLLTLLDRDGKTPRLIADLIATSTPASFAKSTHSQIHLYDSAGKNIWSAP